MSARQRNALSWKRGAFAPVLVCFAMPCTEALTLTNLENLDQQSDTLLPNMRTPLHDSSVAITCPFSMSLMCFAVTTAPIGSAGVAMVLLSASRRG